MRKLHRTAPYRASTALAGLALATGTALSAAPPAGAVVTATMDFPSQFSVGSLRNVNSGKCLQPSDENFFGNGDLVVQRACNTSFAQLWELIPIGKKEYLGFLLFPTYRIVNLGSGLCLDDRDGVSSDGAIVQQWACNTTSTTMMWGDDSHTDDSNTDVHVILNLRASNRRDDFMCL